MGREIVNLLAAEGVGVPVYTRRKGESRINVKIDREPGQEDFSVRQQAEDNRRLLGIILPVNQTERKFVFVSGDEEGFVFVASSRRATDFNPEEVSVLDLAGWNKFCDFFKMANTPEGSEGMKIVFREGRQSENFEEVVFKAVQAERQRLLEAKRKMGEVRKSLFEKLFNR